MTGVQTCALPIWWVDNVLMRFTELVMTFPTLFALIILVSILGGSVFNIMWIIGILGWTGVAFPEQYGGTGGNFSDLGVLLEEIGRSLAPAPFFSTAVLGGMTVMDAGSDAQKDELISRICAGTIIMTMAISESGAANEPWDIQATASPQGGGFQISGTKLFVPDAGAADTIMVAARTSSGSDPAEGISLFLVPAGAGGLNITPMQSVGNERVFEVILENVSVPADAVIGTVGEAWPIIERTIMRATAAQCIEMLGGAQAVLDMTVEYAKGRTQFGRAIGSFQAVKHMLADVMVKTEYARSHVHRAAYSIAHDAPARSVDASMAKIAACEAALAAGRASLQVHGAIGDRKSTRLNSSHALISYAVFCLKKKKKNRRQQV